MTLQAPNACRTNIQIVQLNYDHQYSAYKPQVLDLIPIQHISDSYYNAFDIQAQYPLSGSEFFRICQ